MLEIVSGAFCVICFVAMTVVALLGVFFRYVVSSPFMWTEELARYLMVWMGFVAISIALRQDRHIKVEFLVSRLPAGAGRAVLYLVDLLVGLFMGFLVWQGWLMTQNTIMTASTFHLSMFWILMAVPMGAGLSLFQLLVSLLVKILKDVSGGGEAAEAAGQNDNVSG